MVVASRFVIVWLALGGAISCRARNIDSDVKIVGGEAVDKSSDKRAFDATLILYLLSGTEQSTCTGTLIGPSHIVTAGHCLKSATAVYVGWGPQFSGPESSITVTGFTAHQQWTDNVSDRKFDIGVVSFKGTLPANMHPVPFALSGDVTVGSELLLAGYGLAAQEDPETAGILRQVKVKAAVINNKDRILTIEVGTKRGGCNGDSGGPAFTSAGGILKLVGATSGPGAGMENVKCDEGHGTWVMVNMYQGWMKCTFVAHGNPLTSLADDASASECDSPSAASQSNKPSPPISSTKQATQYQDKWCDPYKPETCFPYCTNGSSTGGGFGYQENLGGSCKVR